MNLLPFLAVLAVGAAMPLAAMDKESSSEKAPSATLNTTCPMCSKAVGEDPDKVKITVGEGAQAKSYYIASDSKTCSDEFMKNPEPYMKKLFGKDAPGAKTPNK